MYVSKTLDRQFCFWNNAKITNVGWYILAFEIAVPVNDAALNDVRESDAPNAAIIVHDLNVTNANGDVMVSVYPAANRTYDVYVHFNEEPTLDEYVFNITVSATTWLKLFCLSKICIVHQRRLMQFF